MQNLQDAGRRQLGEVARLIETFRERKRHEAEAAEIAALRDKINALTSSVAYSEGDVATDNYVTGSLIVADGRLCRVTRAVVRNERFVEGINVTPVSVAEIIDAIEGKE